MDMSQIRKRNGAKLEGSALGDLSVEPDIQVVPDAPERDVVQIDADLSVHLDEVTIVTEPTDGGAFIIEPVPEPRWRMFKMIGPELVAGVVIVLLFAVFAVLMVLDVANQDTDQGLPEPEAPAPAAVVEVEIGTAATLERE